jgi:hypothetical protein
MTGITRRSAMEAGGVVAAMAAIGGTNEAHPMVTPTPDPQGRGGAFAKAWSDYLEALEQSRTAMMADPACADPAVREAALYLPAQMQAAAFYMQIAPHTGYPLLQRTHVGEPIGLNWGMPNPDFDYRWTYLDGSKRYRIHGPRNLLPRLAKRFHHGGRRHRTVSRSEVQGT